MIMLDHVRTGRRKHLQIMRAIVAFIPVLVMNDLSLFQGPSEARFCDDEVLVHVPMRIGAGMSRTQHEHIAVLDDALAAMRLGTTGPRAIPWRGIRPAYIVQVATARQQP